MTRLLVALLLIPVLALGQTYVRPSKGAPIYPFATAPSPILTEAACDNGWEGVAADGGFPYITNGTPYIEACSTPYDWSAFDGLALRVYSATHVLDEYGEYCDEKSPLQSRIGGVGSVMRVRLYAGEGVVLFNIEDAPTSAGPFFSIATVNPGYGAPAYVGCPIIVQVTPVPFIDTSTNPPVVFTTADGGSLVSSDPVVVKYLCSASKSTNDSVGITAQAAPLDGGLASRWSIRVCNSPRNSGTPVLTCTSDGQTPVATASSPGAALEVGDCVTFNTASGTQCISDTAATRATIEECQ